MIRKISGGLALAWSVGMLAGGPAAAQQAAAPDATLEKIEVTGSIIRRIEAEGALPVTVINRDAIDRSGVQSVTDLIQNLPAMTGGNFQQSSSSVNGNGFGETTAALHGLDQKYTLVLLNGRRIAPFGGFGQSSGDGSVNLESLPLDAIDRVEVLTDGASAIYGSDAIAGVVNFITKKNSHEGTVFFNDSSPQHPGAQSWTAGISKGFGDLNSDGWNVLATYSHDYQEKLMASQRDVSKRGGLITLNGGTLFFDQTSSNSLPGSLYLSNGGSFSPFYQANGNCGTNPVVYLSGTKCRTNYAATVQDIPGSTRDSVYLSGRFKLNPDTTLYGEALYAKYDMKAAFAPPAQPMGLGIYDLPGQPLNILWQKYVVPYETANNNNSPGATMHYRAFDAGGRTDDYITDATHFVFGAEGTFQGWDYNANVVISGNVDKDNLAGGYLDFTKFVNLIATGAYDPLIPIPGQSLSSAILSGTFNKTTSTQNMLSLRASKDVFAMPAGPASLGLGLDYTMQHIKQEPTFMAEFGNLTAQQVGVSDYAVGGLYGYLPMDAKRNSYGLFAEMLMPVANKVEVTASARFDAYDKVHSEDVYAQNYNTTTGLLDPQPAGDLGNTFSHATFKLSFRAQPTDQLLLRGSYGTGFKAPTITQIASNLYFQTNTSGSYQCPFPATAYCTSYPNASGPYQFDLLGDGNPYSGGAGLKAEISRQWTLGARFEPVKAVSLGADLWSVTIDNQILAGVPENYAFANPTAINQSLWVPGYIDPSGAPTPALKQIPYNIGRSENMGLDLDFTYRQDLGWGGLTADLTATHMLKSRYQLNGGWQTDLGQFGPDNNVVFRNIARLVTSLKTGDFTNTVTISYKSGYADQPIYASSGTVSDINGNGVDYFNQVDALTIVDWQGRYSPNKSWTFMLGVKNVFDKAPPLSLKLIGGNQVGYDGRYADPTGRAWLFGASFHF